MVTPTGSLASEARETLPGSFTKHFPSDALGKAATRRGSHAEWASRHRRHMAFFQVNGRNYECSHVPRCKR
jgi:hypothetical protein